MYIANIIFQGKGRERDKRQRHLKKVHLGLSGPDQPKILFCETPAKLADNPFSC